MATFGLSLTAQAQEVGNVLSRTPVYQQVAVPRQVCTQTQVSVPGQTTGAGALMGAVAGGAIGNAVGKGEGRADFSDEDDGGTVACPFCRLGDERRRL